MLQVSVVATAYIRKFFKNYYRDILFFKANPSICNIVIFLVGILILESRLIISLDINLISC